MGVNGTIYMNDEDRDNNDGVILFGSISGSIGGSDIGGYSYMGNGRVILVRRSRVRGVVIWGYGGVNNNI